MGRVASKSDWESGWVPPVDLGDAESSMTTESYRTVMEAWPYRHDLDQVVEEPDGTLVAFALGWLDEVNGAGDLEPGTIRDMLSGDWDRRRAWPALTAPSC